MAAGRGQRPTGPSTQCQVICRTGRGQRPTGPSTQRQVICRAGRGQRPTGPSTKCQASTRKSHSIVSGQAPRLSVRRSGARTILDPAGHEHLTAPELPKTTNRLNC